jgi:hypothetical protein
MSPRRRARLRRRIVIGAVLVAVATVVVLEALGGAGQRRDPPALSLLRGPHAQVEARLRPIARTIEMRVQRIRGLRFHHRPRVVVMGERHLAAVGARLVEHHRRHAEQDPAKFRQAQRLQRASTRFDQLAGLLPPQVAFGPDAQVAGLDRIGGAYDYRHERIIIVPTLIQTRVQLDYTLAHELTHALESQHFNLRLATLAAANESAQARRAVIEGTATFVQNLYRRRYLHDRVPVRERLEGMRSVIAAGPAPYAVNAQAIFDYAGGGLFVHALYKRAHGFRLVNQALRRPPRSSEQILHPSRWPEPRTSTGLGHPGRTQPAIRLGVEKLLRAGWRRVGGGTAGEERALTILLAGTIANEATAGASGWDGGRFAVWRPRSPGAECGRGCAAGDVGVIAFRWRRPADAQQFSLAFPTYTTIQLLAEPVGRRTWRLGDGYVSLGTASRGSALAFAPRWGLARKLSHRAATRAADVRGGI